MKHITIWGTRSPNKHFIAHCQGGSIHIL